MRPSVGTTIVTQVFAGFLAWVKTILLLSSLILCPPGTWPGPFSFPMFCVTRTRAPSLRVLSPGSAPASRRGTCPICPAEAPEKTCFSHRSKHMSKGNSRRETSRRMLARCPLNPGGHVTRTHSTPPGALAHTTLGARPVRGARAGGPCGLGVPAALSTRAQGCRGQLDPWAAHFLPAQGRPAK